MKFGNGSYEIPGGRIHWHDGRSKRIDKQLFSRVYLCGIWGISHRNTTKRPTCMRCINARERIQKSLPSIPDEALPVAEEIRRAVPRPNSTPSLFCDQLGGSDYCPRFLVETRDGWHCPYTPTGLHPDSTDCLAHTSAQFANGLFSDAQVKAYCSWWNEQEDMQAAVGAQWPMEAE